MIKESRPLSMPEALEYLNKKEEQEANLMEFIKKFVKLPVKKAQELRVKISELNLMKLKDEDITKIIDVMPEKSEELNKTLPGVNLDEDETKKVLETIKEFN